MALGQVILDTMEMLDQELQLQTGEADVTRGIIAINRAQDLLESVIATRAKVKGSTTGTVVTVADTETTTFPADLLRIDKLQYINPTTSLPAWDLVSIKEPGGHAPSSGWPWSVLSSASTGKPRAYTTSGLLIYWAPLPDAVHTVRWYGFKAAADISAAGTIVYDDIFILPLATMGARLMRVGVGDDTIDLFALAAQSFGPAIDAISRFNRDGASPLQYKYSHEV